MLPVADRCYSLMGDSFTNVRPLLRGRPDSDFFRRGAVYGNLDDMAVRVLEKHLMNSAGIHLVEVGNAVLVEAFLCLFDVFHFECQMIGKSIDRLASFLRKLLILDDVNLDTIVVEPRAAEVERRPLDLAETLDIPIERFALIGLIGNSGDVVHAFDGKGCRHNQRHPFSCD